MQEMHPVLFRYEEDADSGVSTLQYSCFSAEVWEETSGLDYYSRETYESAPNYSFMHRLDEILMAGIESKLNLEHFLELDYDIYNFCSDLEKSPVRPPPGFIMVMDAQ